MDPSPRPTVELVKQAFHRQLSRQVDYSIPLVPQLKRAGPMLNFVTACSIGSAETELFWQLWCFLVIGSHAFSVGGLDLEIYF